MSALNRTGTVKLWNDRWLQPLFDLIVDSLRELEDSGVKLCIRHRPRRFNKWIDMTEAVSVFRLLLDRSRLHRQAANYACLGLIMTMDASCTRSMPTIPPEMIMPSQQQYNTQRQQ